MKKILLIFLFVSLLFSCKNTNQKVDNKRVDKPLELSQKKPVATDSLYEQAVIYEANIRQYSPEGTFNAFAKDIPELKKLGVKILWVMPIFPISEVKRKATDDQFTSQIKDSLEQKKYLGSPYAVADYTKVNPDFGNLDDLKKLIETAHNNGMLVILDWVANHTGWDHPWIASHPEYYTKNKEGKITDPLNDDGSSKGWQDVADLNYDNAGLHKAMIHDMKYWLTTAGVDGFRCDVAGEVPVSFWQEAIPKLRKVKPIFMLAEAWEPTLLKDHLFDMCYGWESHFLMADIAKGKKNVNDWDRYIKKIDTMYEPDDIIMNFTENHDENSWKGTVKETFGDAAEVMAVLTYMSKGMPLIYSGQEYGLNHKLKFFEKDSIPKTKGKCFDLYQKLGKLKQKNVALNGGKHPADYQRIKTSDDKNILAFKRQKKGQTILFIANLSNQAKSFKISDEASYQDVMLHQPIEINKDKEISLPKWAYRILLKK